jgi:hypothetical protein
VALHDAPGPAGPTEGRRRHGLRETDTLKIQAVAAALPAVVSANERGGQQHLGLLLSLSKAFSQLHHIVSVYCNVV